MNGDIADADDADEGQEDANNTRHLMQWERGASTHY
jgi:hypothetical protein